MYAVGIYAAAVNSVTIIYCARVSNIVWREKNRRSDEISTVFIAIYGNKRSGANNCATFSRSRIKCISVPLIITSAARGRVL